MDGGPARPVISNSVDSGDAEDGAGAVGSDASERTLALELERPFGRPRGPAEWSLAAPKHIST